MPGGCAAAAAAPIKETTNAAASSSPTCQLLMNAPRRKKLVTAMSAHTSRRVSQKVKKRGNEIGGAGRTFDIHVTQQEIDVGLNFAGHMIFQCRIGKHLKLLGNASLLLPSK